MFKFNNKREDHKIMADDKHKEFLEEMLTIVNEGIHANYSRIEELFAEKEYDYEKWLDRKGELDYKKIFKADLPVDYLIAIGQRYTLEGVHDNFHETMDILAEKYVGLENLKSVGYGNGRKSSKSIEHDRKFKTSKKGDSIDIRVMGGGSDLSDLPPEIKEALIKALRGEK